MVTRQMERFQTVESCRLLTSYAWCETTRGKEEMRRRRTRVKKRGAAVEKQRIDTMGVMKRGDPGWEGQKPVQMGGA